MRETKDVVDKEKHVLIALITEVFRHGQGRERDAQTRAGRFVHLPINERDLRLAQILLIDDARFAHFRVKIVAFAGAFADSGEHGEPAVSLGDVVDQLQNNDRLSDACAPERANFAAFGERTNEIDNFDPCLENLKFHILLHESRSGAMNRIALREFDRALVINRIAGDVKNATERSLAHRHGNRSPGIVYVHSALEAFGR